ncbi:hypothetical protein [Streptomyces sp. NPDC002611]
MAEDPMLPSAVRALLHRLPPGTDTWDLIDPLTGKGQPLWGFLTDCVARDDKATLRQVLTDRTPLHDVLDEAPAYTRIEEPADAPLIVGEPAAARALRAYAALGLTLVGDADDAGHHLRIGTSWLARSAAAARANGPETAEWTAPDDSRHGERLASLLASDSVDDSVRTHLALVLLALDGALPKPLRGPGLTVLAERGSIGARFDLRLDLVRGLPSGLLPDPRVMSGFLGDEGFRSALEDAWRIARPAKPKGAVLWSLRGGDGPVDHVGDSSFGAAFAVLLSELGRTRGNPLGPLRLSRVNPRTSVVGAMSAENTRVIQSVTGYRAKLSVVEDGERVVVPERDERQVRDLGGGASVVGAATVEEAAKAARRLDVRAASRLVAGVLATGLVASLVAWGFASGESARNNRRAVAAGLAAKAVGMRGSEPRTAGLLALAGYRIDPGNKDAENAIQEVLETNRNTVRSWKADRTVSVLAVDDAGHRAYTSGIADTIQVWDTGSGRKLAEVKGRASGLVRGVESGILAAHDGRDVRLFDASGDKPEELGTVKAPSCTGAYSEIVGMGFTDNGSGLTTVWDDGAVSEIEPASRTLTGCTRLRDVAGKTLLGRLPTTNRLAMSADVVPSYAGPGGGADQVVLLLTTNEVVSVNLGTKKVSELLPAEDVPGKASLVQASQDVVTVATSGGVLAWDRARKRSTYPLGGLSTRPTAMELEANDVVIAGPGGTAVIPVQSSPDGASAPLSVPSGGRTVAAVRAGDGTVVTAGEGRVTVLGNTPVHRALPPAQPSTGSVFGPGNTLLLTDFMTNTSYGAYSIDLDSVPETISAAGASYEHVTEYSASGSYINALALSDKFVAAVGQSRGIGTVTLWKRDGTYLQQLDMSPEEDRKRTQLPERIVSQVDFVPKHRLLVARHVSGDVGIWQTGTWRRLGTIDLKAGTSDMAIHGRTGVFTEGEGEEARLVMVDLVTRRKLRSVAAPGVVRVTYSRDGSRLVTLDMTSGTVRLLDGRKLTALGDPLRMPEGELAVDSAISPDGRLVATAMGDRVLVHNLDSGQQSMPPLRDVNGTDVVQVKWSPDGTYLAGASLPPQREHKQPGAVNIWKMTEGSLEKRLCDWTDGGLSRDEWEKHVDESVSYIELCEDVKE